MMMESQAQESSSPLVILVVARSEERSWLRRFLESSGFEVKETATDEGAVNILEALGPPAVVCDLHGPGIDASKILQVARRLNLETGVVLLAEKTEMDACIQAIKSGAYDFLLKPIDKARLITSLDRMIQFQRTVRENEELHRTLDDYFGLLQIVGRSQAMKKVLAEVRQVSSTKTTVLLVGETGTGKDLMARALHHTSPRKDLPFIKMNCGSLAESLVESELFGHERGAFTGATERRKGRFELADKGTLFLDEVGELTPRVQVKLLRVLEEGQFERLGGSQTLRVDVRLIAATNRNMEEAVRQGQFREDLYYRLKVVTLHLPPMSERKEDIPDLCLAFLREFVHREGKNIQGITEEAMSFLSRCDWPGNVRQIRNCIEGMVVMGKGPLLGPQDLPEEMRVLDRNDRYITIPIGASMEDVERTVLIETLRAARGDKREVARVLKVGLRSVYRKLEKFGLADEVRKLRQPA